MRVAIVHYWLLGMRGGESVVESLCRMLPEADIFTLFYDPSRVSETIRSHRVTASYLNPLRRHYRALLPFMPSALESFDLRGYDLVISSESGPAKGVITPAATRHVCYCHTPMRYLWELYPAYLNEWTHSGIKRLLMRPMARNLRLWDFASAARVDRLRRQQRECAAANLEDVSQRIYGRASPCGRGDFLLSAARGLLSDRLRTGSRISAWITPSGIFRRPAESSASPATGRSIGT